MSVVIREAREAELEEIARILASAFEQHRHRVDPALFERYLEEMVNVRARQGDTNLFVAVEDERILGTGTLYPPNRGREYALTVHSKPWPNGWASLRLLAVDPAHSGRSIGRMLIEARVERARELDAKAVALHTSKEFEAARHLVQRMGWKRVPDYDHAPTPEICAEAYVLNLVNGN